MKTTFYSFLLFLLACNNSTSQDVPLTKDADLIFKDVNTAATNAELNQIFELTNFQLALNGTQYYFKGDDGGVHYPFDVFVYPVDVNGDGIEELGVMYGNTYTSGGAGMSVLLFIKNKEGNYESNLGYPGYLTFMPSNHDSYTDLMIQGMGFVFAVWTWNGTNYEFDREIHSSESDKLKLISLEEASKVYVAGLKN